MDNKKSFVMYRSWANLIENLDDLKAGELIKAICAHVNGHDVVIEDKTIQAVYTMIEEKIDEDSEKYSEVVEKRKEAIKKRWTKNTKEQATNTNEYKCIQENSDTVTDTESDTDTVSSTKIYIGNKEKRKRFTPPTLEEVKSYCQERKNSVDPERFINFYESKGWVVGKSPMKDWKAAVRNWEKDSKVVTTNKFKNFDERSYDMDSLEAELVAKSMSKGN